MNQFKLIDRLRKIVQDYPMDNMEDGDLVWEAVGVDGEFIHMTAWVDIFPDNAVLIQMISLYVKDKKGTSNFIAIGAVNDDAPFNWKSVPVEDIEGANYEPNTTVIMVNIEWLRECAAFNVLANDIQRRLYYPPEKVTLEIEKLLKCW